MRNSGYSWKVLFLLQFSIVVVCDDLIRGSEETSLFGSQGDSESSETRAIADVLEPLLLDKMGMAARPRPKRHVPIPEHLTELYYHDGGLSPYNDFDSAHSFYPEDSVQIGTQTTNFVFKLEGLHDDEYLEAAELRLNIQSASEEVEREDSSHSIVRRFRVNVYEFNGQNDTILADTKVVDCSSSDSWLTVDVSGAVERWRRKKDKTGRIQLEVPLPSRRACSLNLSHRPLTPSSPVVILYTNDYIDDEESDDSEDRTKRSASGGHGGRRRKHRRRHRHRHQRGRKRPGEGGGGRRGMCRREELYVDFEKVGWQDWIFAPAGYQAYYCSGECPFPLSSHMNATNHAVIQTLIHAVSPGLSPQACCVPSELSPISLLYLNEFEKVVLKNYQDMVVQACGCR